MNESNLAAKLKAVGYKEQKRPWDGPYSESDEGGITQSLLSSFLCCRERFRIKTIEGWQIPEGWSHRLGYGEMWHLCEEYHAADKDWEKPLLDFVKKEVEENKEARVEIEKWYNVCKLQFPIYAAYWRVHKDVKKREPLLSEESFRVRYELPSGREVYLRGKFDSVDAVGKAIWLQENKTKGEIDEQKLLRQLSSGFELQTMFYLTALRCFQDQDDRIYDAVPIKGVRYNVVRRPLSGGRGSIRQHKPTKSKPRGESLKEYYARLAGIIRGEPEYYFMRWNVEISKKDLQRFQKECLNPILEQLCDWYDVVTNIGKDKPFEDGLSTHYRMPYNVYNPTLEGRFTPIDSFIDDGNTTGLTRVKTLFPELD